MTQKAHVSWILITGMLCTAGPLCLQGQNLQNSGLQFQQIIQIPGWGATGSRGNANVDVFGYNPLTRLLYLADRTNVGIDVINTQTNEVVGLIPLPPNAVPNVPLVAIDLQQLVVSDGVNSVYVWDLRAPKFMQQPDQYIMPSTTPDGMDYDPVNQTVYVITDDAPYYLVGISLPYKQIVSETQLPVSADLIKWNPIDGKIYISTEDADNKNAQAGVWSYDPATQKLTSVAIAGPACPGHGIDIDPISDVAMVGCFGGTSSGDIAVNLANGTILKTFTDVGGTDTVVFNPNNRRFYAGAGLNTATTSGCPSPLAGPFGKTVPVVGVFDAKGPAGNVAQLDGVACTGSGHVAGVDPISNYVYVPVSQYPPDPTSTTTGLNGVLVFRDTSAPAQNPVTSAQVTLAALGTSGIQGTVSMALNGRRIRLQAYPAGVNGKTAWVVIPTTVGNEVVQCAVVPSSASAVCNEFLVGDPLIGSTATFVLDGTAAARGTVTLIQ